MAKKYGGAIIALTLDEDGIPDTAEGRYAIAERIIRRAEGYGISKKDIIVDPLALTISSDPHGALVTLESIRIIRERLGVCTSLGVSNISFGLPSRETVNSTFFAIALGAGLSAAIINPHSLEMMKVYHAFRALSAKDENCKNYIDFAANIPSATAVSVAPSVKAADEGDEPPLCHAIVKGLRDAAFARATELLATNEPLSVINDHIVPALDKVGAGFESGRIFLPQLLMSAEAAKSAFEAVKQSMGDATNGDKGKIILATVKGDIHDIGKNIVKALLSNYGFGVIDLGKDVAPELICETAISEGVRLVGLSALMTTTVPAMEETIKLLREKAPEACVFVGGAVLTQEYADMIGADAYCKDAMGAVRYAEGFFSDK